MDEGTIDRAVFYKINYIFGDIDFMATKNADLERSRAVLEKCDIVLHQNVVQRGVRSDRKLLMVNGDCNQQGKRGHYARARTQARAHPSKS